MTRTASQRRRNQPILPTNEVQVGERKGDSNLTRTYQALDWLAEQGWDDEDDFSINMWGGLKGYTSFFFADHRKAIEFKLHFGGQAPG